MTDTLAALNSSERMDWQTPGWFLDLVRQVGPIVLDPCTTARNPTGAATFYAQHAAPFGRGAAPGWLGACGLAGSWLYRPGLAFANPPYGAHMSGPVDPTAEIKRKNKTTGVIEVVGVGTGWGRRIASHPGEVLSLVATRHSTEWWGDLFDHSHAVCLWRSPKYGSRIRFVHPETGEPGPQPNLESSVFYSGPPEGRARFVHTFAPHGRVIRGGRHA